MPCDDEPQAQIPAPEPLDRSVSDAVRRFGPIPCRAGHEVWLDDTARLRSCTVDQPISLHGVDVAEGAVVQLHPSGRLAQAILARPHALETAAGTTLRCAAGHVSLSREGHVERCRLDVPTQLGGASCRAGESIALHPDGTLRQATLDAPHAAAGAHFPAGARLRWRPDGSLEGGWLPGPLRLGAHQLQHAFSMHPGGTLASLELAVPEVVGGRALPAGAALSVRSDGSLRSVRYVSGWGGLPHGELWTDTTHLWFDCAGVLVHTEIEHHQEAIPEPPP